MCEMLAQHRDARTRRVQRVLECGLLDPARQRVEPTLTAFCAAFPAFLAYTCTLVARDATEKAMASGLTGK